MKVFISWSGELSRAVAELVATWIPDVLQGTETWISNKDIEKGAIWFDEIQSSLKDVATGILCVTRDNLNAPWLLFESGALSKGLSKNRVIPLLIGLNPSDLRAPLAQFNCAHPTKEEMRKVIFTINRQGGEKSPPEERVQKAFEKWWNDFETKLIEITAAQNGDRAPKQRTTEDMIQEMLEIVRSLQRRAQDSEVAKLFFSQFAETPLHESLALMGFKDKLSELVRNSSSLDEAERALLNKQAAQWNAMEQERQKNAC
jgi:hypothetical protein